MAVEVVGIARNHIKEVDCKNCASRLQYTGVDIRHYSHTDYTGCTDTYYYIECPRCIAKVHVSKY